MKCVGTDEFHSPSIYYPYPSMCNHLPYVSLEGIESSFKPRNGAAAREIVRLAIRESKAVFPPSICPHIRDCFLKCMTISNRFPHAYPDVPEIENPDGVDGRICNIVLNSLGECGCESADDYFLDEKNIRIPKGLLQGDE